MHQEVFKVNIFRAIILPAILTIIFLFIFIETDVPYFFMILFIIPAGFAIGGQTDKVIVEDDILRYEHGFMFKKQDEVSLKVVSRIEVRTVKEWVEDSDGKNKLKTNKYAYVVDESGQVFFTFDADFISKRNRRRFEDAVTASNPTIEVS